MISKLRNFRNTIRFLYQSNHELLWAKIWDDTRQGISWAKNIGGISPGRWAVGYNYLYVMTRVLYEMMPEKVLDLGLGISSTLISAYVEEGENREHVIVEQNKDWISFFCNKHDLSDKSRILHLPLVEMNNKDGMKYHVYDGFVDSMSNQRFSVISIDGPTSGDNYISRVDIVNVIPEILEKEFAIVLDDSNRSGEKKTIDDIQRKLRDHGIDFCIGYYPGMTDVCIITDSNNRFLCTL